ncbi:MAG: spore maturation protein A, partial [Oscillospiraceae bacterium]|nr:spore maturation protein A [Oscillospiraceae bacterium]
MMNYIFSGMIVFGIVIALLCGRMEAVSTALMGECGSAVTLVIELTGTMCLWCGLMKVAEQAGLTEKISRLLSPLTRLAFAGLEPDSPAMRAISMNISANLLGLGNAATPLGITAMKELAKLSPRPGLATHHMAMFVVLNTAALDLLPTTTGLLRMQAGSAAPFDILPAVWLASSASVVIGVAVT